MFCHLFLSLTILIIYTLYFSRFILFSYFSSSLCFRQSGFRQERHQTVQLYLPPSDDFCAAFPCNGGVAKRISTRTVCLRTHRPIDYSVYTTHVLSEKIQNQRRGNDHKCPVVGWNLLL